MKVLIVEDEELAVNKLVKTLSGIDNTIEIAGITDSIESSVEWFQNNPTPDLVLMDIELSDGQSFEIFNLTKINSPVIFTTSYDEYALKAFKVNSVDYLLKPVQKNELKAAIEKFKDNFKATPASNLENLMKELQQKLETKNYRKRFLVKNANRLTSVEVEEIAYFYSDGRFNFFKTYDNKKMIIDYTMEELQDMLDPDRFFRISRAFYIALKSIDKIEDYFGNRLILQLKPAIEKEAVVSREKVTEFKLWMGK